MKYKIGIIPVIDRKAEILSKITIGYLPSSIAISKCFIKVKALWTPMTESINNPYFDITAADKTNVSYTLDYYNLGESAANTCDWLPNEIIKDNFYSTFKLNSTVSLLKTIGIYKIDKVSYTKIKEDYLEMERNFENTWITFKNAYTKVYINQMNKVHFKYIKETIDTF